MSNIGGWLHGHYSASKEPLGVLVFLGGFPRRVMGVQGVGWRGLNLDIKQGGSAIEYRDEDPHIRKMFQEQLAKEGAEPRWIVLLRRQFYRQGPSESYATRKGMKVSEVGRWLSPFLGYDSAKK